MSNPGERLSQLFDKLIKGDQNSSGFDQWFRVLDLDRSSPTREEDAIAGMQAALAEVRGVEHLLSGLNAPPDLFAVASKRLRTMLSPANARAAAKDHMQPQLHGETRIVLRWAAWVLREFNQPDIEESALQTLLESIDEQEELVRAGGLSPYIRDLLMRQIADLRRAVRLYAVQGSAPVQDAYNKSVTALATVPKDVVESSTEADAQAVRKSRDVLEQVGKVSRAGTDLLNFLTNVANAGQSAIGHISQLLLPPPS